MQKWFDYDVINYVILQILHAFMLFVQVKMDAHMFIRINRIDKKETNTHTHTLSLSLSLSLKPNLIDPVVAIGWLAKTEETSNKQKRNV